MGELSGIRALACDFDGVIVDSMGLQHDVWQRALTNVLGVSAGTVLPRVERNLFAGCAGPSMFDGTRLAAGQRRAIRREKDALWLRAREHVTIMPEVAAVIPRLAKRRALTIATTASSEFVHSVLERERLLDAFRCIVTDQDVTRPKPAPDMLLKILAFLHLPPTALAMIGDTEADSRMASAAGCRFIHFAPGATSRDRPVSLGTTVQSWGELETLLTVGARRRAAAPSLTTTSAVAARRRRRHRKPST